MPSRSWLGIDILCRSDDEFTAQSFWVALPPKSFYRTLRLADYARIAAADDELA